MRVWFEEGLMGVMGETPLVAVEVWGDGLMGERLVGEATEREERLREREVEVRSIMGSFMGC